MQDRVVLTGTLTLLMQCGSGGARSASSQLPIGSAHRRAFGVSRRVVVHEAVDVCHGRKRAGEERDRRAFQRSAVHHGAAHHEAKPLPAILRMHESLDRKQDHECGVLERTSFSR